MAGSIVEHFGELVRRGLRPVDTDLPEYERTVTAERPKSGLGFPTPPTTAPLAMASKKKMAIERTGSSLCHSQLSSPGWPRFS